MLLPCFAPTDGRSEGVSEGRPGRTLSTATSGLSAMSTDDGSGELAAAAAAALASQEERAAAEATAEAARQTRREQRRAEKEARRQKLLQVRPVRAGKGGSAASCVSGAMLAGVSGRGVGLLTVLLCLTAVQEKKEAKARARAEARRRYEDQLQRWEAAVADKRQQVADLHQQVRTVR